MGLLLQSLAVIVSILIAFGLEVEALFEHTAAASIGDLVERIDAADGATVGR